MLLNTGNWSEDSQSGFSCLREAEILHDIQSYLAQIS
jgi:hypothetical protein